MRGKGASLNTKCCWDVVTTHSHIKVLDSPFHAAKDERADIYVAQALLVPSVDS
jgi:hypothetical protein